MDFITKDLNNEVLYEVDGKITIAGEGQGNRQI